MIDLPKRKPIRIENYDYSTPGAYFITVCVNNRKPIMWNVGAATCRPNTIPHNVGAATSRPFFVLDCGRQIAAPTLDALPPVH